MQCLFGAMKVRLALLALVLTVPASEYACGGPPPVRQFRTQPQAQTNGMALGLTNAQSTAIWEYTGDDLFQDLNAFLNRRMTDPMGRLQAYAQLIRAGLNNLPEYRDQRPNKIRTLLMRGEPLGQPNAQNKRRIDIYKDLAAQPQAAQRVFTPPFLFSTSFGDGLVHRPVFMLIECKLGHPGRNIDQLSYFTDEQEILFPPGSKFQIDKVVDLNSADPMHLRKLISAYGYELSPTVNVAVVRHFVFMYALPATPTTWTATLPLP